MSAQYKYGYSCIPAILLLAALLTGCSTPESRIKSHQAAFDAYPASVQEMIRKGQVDLGFTENMVFLALGEPDRKYSRLAASGSSTIWSYTDSYTTPTRQRVNGSFRVKDGDGRYRTIEDNVMVDVNQVHEYERKRVEFQDGIVVAIEDVEMQRGLLAPTL